MSQEIIQIKCNRCGQVFPVYKPEDNLHNTVYCPNCKNKITLMLNPVDVQVGGYEQFPTLGQALPVPEKNNLYYIKETAVAGKRYSISCGCCGKKMVVAAQPGINKKICPECQAVTAFGTGDLKNRQQASQQKSEKKPTQKIADGGQICDSAELTWGRLFSFHHYPLKPGVYYIGQKSVEKPSDIQLDDPYASRRSVSVEMMPQGGGWTYKLNVHKATNPVLVNSMNIPEGDSIYLNFGDTITMGKTRLTFKKAKK